VAKQASQSIRFVYKANPAIPKQIEMPARLPNLEYAVFVIDTWYMWGKWAIRTSVAIKYSSYQQSAVVY